DKVEEAYDSDARVEDVLAVLRALPYERFVLQGDSDGVRMALHVYHAMPERIAKLILFGFAMVGRFSPDNPLGVRDEELASLEEYVAEHFLKPDYRTALTTFATLVANEPGMSAWRELLVEDWQRRLDEATFRGFLSGLRQASEEDLVPGVTVP